MLQGFRDTCKGEILIDGKNLKSCTKQHLRNSINVVLQNTYINENESIRVNLLGIEADSEYQKDRRGSNTDKLSDENL